MGSKPSQTPQPPSIPSPASSNPFGALIAQTLERRRLNSKITPIKEEKEVKEKPSRSSKKLKQNDSKMKCGSCGQVSGSYMQKIAYVILESSDINKD